MQFFPSTCNYMDLYEERCYVPDTSVAVSPINGGGNAVP